MARDEHKPRIRFGTDLVAYYDLNHGFSGTAKISDASRNGNTGIVNGSSALPKRPGFDFDGTEDRIEIADDPTFDNTVNKTVCVWAKNNSIDLTEEQILVSKFSISSDNREWSIGVFPDEKVRVVISGTGSSSGVLWDWHSNSAIDDTSVWHMYAFTFDAGAFVMYIDGDAVDATDIQSTSGAVMNNGAAPVLIGAWFTNWATPAYGYYWAGRIGQVMIYNRTLSANDIRGLDRQTRASYRV